MNGVDFIAALALPVVISSHTDQLVPRVPENYFWLTVALTFAGFIMGRLTK